MGFSGKPQVDVSSGGGLEFDAKKWVISGISLRAPLMPLCTKSMDKGSSENSTNSYNTDEECSCTTPTGEESKIRTRLTSPPPAPRKKKATLKCNYSGVRELFTPPDLETVFIRNDERAK